MAGLCREVIFAGKVFSGPDTLNYFIPTAAYGRQWIGQGALPLWNSMTFCGWPLVGDAQLRWLYPPNLLLLVFDPAVAFSILAIASIAFGAVGMWAYLRLAAGTSPWPATCGAATFGLSGFFAAHLMGGIVVFPMTAAWLPWILLLGWRLGRPGTVPRDVSLLAAAICCQVMSGAPQIVFFTWVALAIQAIWRTVGESVQRSRDASSVEVAWRRGTRVLFRFMVAGGLGIALSASLLLPVGEFGKLSFQRSGKTDFKQATDTSLSYPFQWLMVAPRFFDNPHVERRYWAAGGDRVPKGYWDICGYVGIGPLAVLLVALFSWSRLFWNRAGERVAEGDAGHESGPSPLPRGFAEFHLALALLALGLALGRHSPLFRLFYYAVPGFDMFRVPARWVLIWQFGVATIFALVVERLCARRNTKLLSAPRVLIPLGVLTLLLVVAAFRTTDVLTAAGIGKYHVGFGASGGDPVHAQLKRSAALSLARGAGLSIAWLLLLAAAPWLHRLRRGPAAAFLAAALVLVDVISFGVSVPDAKSRFVQRQEYLRKSPLVEFLQTQGGGRRLLALDDVHSYMFDQNQPELWANRAMVHGLRDARGYYPICLRWFGRFVNAMSGKPADRHVGALLFVGPGADLNVPLLSLLDVGFLLSYEPIHRPGLRLVQTTSFGLRIYEVTAWRGPAYLAKSRPTEQLDAGAELALLASGKIDPAIEATAAMPPPDAWPTGSAAAPGKIVRVERPSPTRFRLELERGTADLLVLSEAYHPGWRATVDGEPAEVIRANHAFIGVYLPPDARKVEVRFQPLSFRLGLYVSFVAWLVVTATAVAGFRRGARS